VHALNPQELQTLSLEPNWADLAPDDRQYRVVALDEPPPLADVAVAEICRWLEAQPIPVIGIGPPGRSPLQDGVDLRVDNDAELAQVIGSVERNPMAAAVLVQVLRAVGSLAPLAALAVESLGYSTLQAGAEFGRWLDQERQRRPARRVPVRDDLVLLERDGEHLGVVLNSTDTRNSLSVAMRDALTDAFRLVAMDATIVRVDVSGNGPCFSAGGDLGEFGALHDPLDAHRARMLRMPARYIVERATSYHFHLHGACIGAGIELPAFGGHLSATRDAFFRLPEVGMGLIPGAGGCVSISRRIGRQRTALMALLGEPVSAERALNWGLIDAIVD
jgi:enoyl-CoA hydratase